MHYHYRGVARRDVDGPAFSLDQLGDHEISVSPGLIYGEEPENFEKENQPCPG